MATKDARRKFQIRKNYFCVISRTHAEGLMFWENFISLSKTAPMNAQAAKLKEKQQLIDQFVNYAIGKFEEGDFENAKRVSTRKNIQHYGIIRFCWTSSRKRTRLRGWDTFAVNLLFTTDEFTMLCAVLTRRSRKQTTYSTEILSRKWLQLINFKFDRFSVINLRSNWNPQKRKYFK